MMSLGGGRCCCRRPGIYLLASLFLQLFSSGYVLFSGSLNVTASVSACRRTLSPLIPSGDLDSTKFRASSRARVLTPIPRSVLSRQCYRVADVELKCNYLSITAAVLFRSGFEKSLFTVINPRSGLSLKLLRRFTSYLDLQPQTYQRSHSPSCTVQTQLRLLLHRLSKSSMINSPTGLHCQVVRHDVHTGESNSRLCFLGRDRYDIFKSIPLNLIKHLLFVKDWMNIHETDGGVPGSDVSLAPFTGFSNRRKIPTLCWTYHRFVAAYLTGLTAIERHTGTVSFGKNVSVHPPLVVRLWPVRFSLTAIIFLMRTRETLDWKLGLKVTMLIYEGPLKLTKFGLKSWGMENYSPLSLTFKELHKSNDIIMGRSPFDYEEGSMSLFFRYCTGLVSGSLYYPMLCSNSTRHIDLEVSIVFIVCFSIMPRVSNYRLKTRNSESSLL